MAHDTLRDTALVRAFTDLLADLSDLIQNELRLARAEITRNLTLRLQAAVWFAVAALLGLMVFLLLVEGMVFALANAGFSLHSSCFLVAGGLALVAALAFLCGRAGSSENLTPTRTARQFNEALRTAKEHLR